MSSGNVLAIFEREKILLILNFAPAWRNFIILENLFTISPSMSPPSFSIHSHHCWLCQFLLFIFTKKTPILSNAFNMPYSSNIPWIYRALRVHKVILRKRNSNTLLRTKSLSMPAIQQNSTADHQQNAPFSTFQTNLILFLAAEFMFQFSFYMRKYFSNKTWILMYFKVRETKRRRGKDNARKKLDDENNVSRWNWLKWLCVFVCAFDILLSVARKRILF